MTLTEQLGDICADIYWRVIVNDIRQVIGLPTSLAFPSASQEQMAILLSRASVLATSDQPENKNLAYDIAARVLNAGSDLDPNLINAISLILTRIGNFPARALVAKRHPSEISNTAVPASLALESVAHEQSNTVEISKKESILFTDFQAVLYERIQQYRAVSFSAPTSAGKSFLLSIDLLRRFGVEGRKSIVFVVPTRALVSQVIRDINTMFALHGIEVPVICIPETMDDEGLLVGVVYVLTQERLLSLLQHTEGKPFISTLIVDEAQEIQSGTRGALLQTAIKRAVKMFPNAELIFSSPLRSNPGILLELFSNSASGTFFTEEVSPVAQNLLSIKEIHRKPKQIDISLITDSGSISIGPVDVKFQFRGGKRELLAKVALNFTRNNDSTIIYANGPREAEDIATIIGKSLEYRDEYSERLSELILFIQTEVHHLHPLADLLKKGCAFHYGHLPSIVRSEIENLAKQGEIQYLVCTSTLLQGVNLPAKNIFIFNPTKGHNKPMSKGDFWNLAGRAGRLTKEFHGNVWCVNIPEWDDNPFQGPKNVEITSAFDSMYLNQSDSILLAAKSTTRGVENKLTNDADYAFSIGFSDYTLNGQDILKSKLCNTDNRQSILELDLINKNLATKISHIPGDIFYRNAGISPYRIEELYNFFETHRKNIFYLAPIHPLGEGAYDRTLAIFEILENVFFKTGNQSFKYHAWLANQWMRGVSLRQLIQDHLKKQNTPRTPKSISTAIEELLKTLETTIRFRHVKYVRVYLDVLQSFYVNAKVGVSAPTIVPLHSYLEYGAAQPTLIHLMALGISRTSAIEIKKALHLGVDLTRSECYTVIKKSTLKSLDLPNLCRREIKSMLSIG